MSEVVFNIENVFSTQERDGVLGVNQAHKYYIPPYQRGYKWESNDENAPVDKLMSDLLEAFEGKEEEYYLQYITVKRTEYKNEKVLELIDGQQRITSLLILLSIISQKADLASTVQDKLVYGIRAKVQAFFKHFLFEDLDVIVDHSWGSFISQNPEYDEQDIYYLFSAAKRISELVPGEKEQLSAFSDYLNQNVQLIINVVEQEISSERIFSNLNSNKVDLTNIELIKGLLLTKAPRDSEDQSFKELKEVRAMMGRQWDEITRWVNRPDVSAFYFSAHESGMAGLLRLIALDENYLPGDKEGPYSLFNHFQKEINRNKRTPIAYFNKLKLFSSILKEWYEDNQLYNRLGYLFFTKDSSFSQDSILHYLRKDKEEVKQSLLQNAVQQIPEDITALEYGKDNSELHKVLLALNIFLDDKEYRFNFHAYIEESWSLEHIFPKNPSKLPDELKEKDLEIIRSLWKNEDQPNLSKYITEEESLEEAEALYTKVIEKIKQVSCKVSDREKEFLYQMIKHRELDSIGNMALLTGSDNSSNSNGMFDSKRINISHRVSKGSFVPQHTYNIFSKLISETLDPDLTVWSKTDIRAHKEWIIRTINQIKKKANP